MLPIATWLQAMNTEATLPAGPPQPRRSLRAARRARLAVGRGFIAIGQALAGNEPISSRTVSVSR